MAVKHEVIYVPGLGDHTNTKQNLALSFWRIFGIHMHYMPMGWSDDEPYKDKQARITEKIIELHKLGGRVSLMAASAGASAILNTFAENKEAVHKVIYLCGKVANIDLVSPNRRLAENPAFVESLSLLPDSIASISMDQRQRILSVHPLADEVVPVADTVIYGTQTMTIPTVGHVLSIAAALTLAAPFIAHFIRKP